MFAGKDTGSEQWHISLADSFFILASPIYTTLLPLHYTADSTLHCWLYTTLLTLHYTADPTLHCWLPWSSYTSYPVHTVLPSTLYSALLYIYLCKIHYYTLHYSTLPPHSTRQCWASFTFDVAILILVVYHVETVNYYFYSALESQPM